MLVNDALKRDNNNLDLIRIICAAAVIFAHAYYLANANGKQEPLQALIGFSYTGAVAVKVFFFISGLLVTNSILTTKSASHFVISRFFRVYPAYLFVIFITTYVIGPIISTAPYSQYLNDPATSIYAVQTSLFNTQYLLPGVFDSNIYKGAVNGSLWTIPYEVAAYTVLLGIFLITSGRSRIISSSICLLVIISPVIGWNKYLFINIDNPDMYMLAPCFALGALFAINKDIIDVSFKIPVGFFILFLFINNEALSHMLFFFMVCTSMLCLSTLNITKLIKVKHDISYGVYLWGFFGQQLVYSFFPDLSLHVNQFVCIGVSVLFGYISFIVIERPFMKAGKEFNRFISIISNGIKTNRSVL